MWWIRYVHRACDTCSVQCKLTLSMASRLCSAGPGTVQATRTCTQVHVIYCWTGVEDNRVVTSAYKSSFIGLSIRVWKDVHRNQAVVHDVQPSTNGFVFYYYGKWIVMRKTRCYNFKALRDSPMIWFCMLCKRSSTIPYCYYVTVEVWSLSQNCPLIA